MAIDTTAKRASASAFLLPFYNGVITDGTITIEETMAASWVYNGIIFPVIVVLPSREIVNFNLYIDKARPFTYYIEQAKGFSSYIDQARNFDLEL